MVNKILVYSVIAVIVILVIAGIIVYNLPAKQEGKTIKIGAVLALSGPSAIWGESARNGMELALEAHPELSVIYEDSKGASSDGITAYQKLRLQEPDLFVSSLSIVSIPLASIVKEDKKVMIVTQSAANNLTNDYVYRYYSDANHFALPAFESDISPLKGVTKLAVVYREDEYAKSVANKVKELSAEQGKEIVFFESYIPNETDFSTILTKAKEANPEALLFIPTPPSESLAILKKIGELKFDIPIIEVSNVQSDPETQAKAPNITFYTEQFAFSIPGNSEPFKQAYRAKYNKEPNFVAAFGYDIINLIASCEKSNIKECLDSKKEVTGVTGTASGIKNHEILLPMYLVRVH
ncbi:MAG: ABC transporter substrate-binding protein [Candidatus ainarchaeum sp.]|nr:ABC transporter substrate-binding protein [Candidatus ainarchaeum sp.]